MPAGDDPLPSGVWQPVPGAPGMRIYPLVRKPDIISSNSYLLDTAGSIILIDPGGLPAQAEQLATVIGEIRAVRKRPVIVILTHTHVDHFLGVIGTPLFDDPAVTVFAAEDTGAEALRTGNSRLTQADFFEKTVPPFCPGIRLFGPGFQEAGGEMVVTM